MGETIPKSLWSFLHAFILTYLLFIFLTLFFVVITPSLVNSENPALHRLGYLLMDYGWILANCHQLPQRSFIIDGVPMPFCSRDVGIYAGSVVGGFAALIELPLPKTLRKRKLHLLLLLPLIVDGLTQSVWALRESSNPLRFATGFFFGLGLLYLAASITVEVKKKRKISLPPQTKKILPALSLVLLVAVFLFSHLDNQDRLSRKQALNLLSASRVYKTYYVTPRAADSLKHDPYLGKYSDDIIISHLASNPPTHGSFIVCEGSGTPTPYPHVFQDRFYPRISLVDTQTRQTQTIHPRN
ncbi:MAG: DUF2085 domain-containing protein [Candidatus Altiarchaeales archaeon]|nr:DUF2085 domain-containing protein [Candidatus Altiarchaeales archaeon]